MPYLLDTAAVSEFRKPRPNAGFSAWSEASAAEDTFLGTPTLGELYQGVHKIAPSPQRRRLERWVMGIEKRYSAHILPFDADAARLWGAINGEALRRGRKLPPVDSQLIAVALVNHLTIVTRNLRDFDMPEFEGLNVVNPWT